MKYLSDIVLLVVGLPVMALLLVLGSGVTALLIGAGALFIFMIFYYHLFGVVASTVLLGNVVLLTALLSMLKAGNSQSTDFQGAQ